MSKKIGVIKEIWRYPVKSMSGNKIAKGELTKDGLVGDRLWTIWDEIDNQLVGGKQFRKIMQLAASFKDEEDFANPIANILFPDGQVVDSKSPYLDNLLSSFIGHPMRLKLRQKNKEFYLIKKEGKGLTALRQQLGMPANDTMKNLAIFPLNISLMLMKYASPPGQLYDVYPLHFMTTNTLTWLAKAHPKANIDVRRFRPTFLIEGAKKLGDFPERKWLGGYLEVGEVVIKVGFPTIRCSMPAQAQPHLLQDNEVAKAIQTTAGQFVGSYGRIVKKGVLEEGMEVRYRPTNKIWQFGAKLGRKMREPMVAALAKMETAVNQLKKPKLESAQSRLEKSGFAPFQVIKVESESENIKSFYLKGKSYHSFLAGQHILLGLIMPTQNIPIIRAYSLSAYNQGDAIYRISVKREGENAVVSNYLHDKIKTGDELYLKRPQGQFFLHPQEDRPLVLISIGIGITPFMAMLDYAAKTKYTKKIALLHGCRNGRHHPFQKELASLSNKATIETHFCYSQPDAEDRGYQHQGRINIKLIQQVAESKEAVFYLCGTDEFMHQTYKELIDWGVNPTNIHYEQFSKAAPLEASLDDAQLTSYEIHFQKSNLKTTWSPASNSLLELAQKSGLQPTFGCKYGFCDACEVKLHSGKITYDSSIPEQKNEHSLLLCCAIPTSDLVIDL